jgi:hypothetical protein
MKYDNTYWIIRRCVMYEHPLLSLNFTDGNLCARENFLTALNFVERHLKWMVAAVRSFQACVF